jgi:adenosyl cobinamide kinase/adenosyl cobinamide phosphate guanylyltransferase
MLTGETGDVLTLVLGGTRSGKSAIAETRIGQLAEPGGGAVTYIATGWSSDVDMAARIDAHRTRRPSTWSTVEAGRELVTALTQLDGPVLVDSLGTWVAQHFDERTESFIVDINALTTALQGRRDDTVIVSEETGLSVHPPTASVRRYVDTLGDVNQAVAALADEVLLVVAGRVLRLETWPS